MKKYIIIIAILFLSASGAYSQQRQSADEVDFLDALGKKNTVSVSEAESLFKMVIDSNLPVMKGETPKDEPVKKGYIAYMVADNLKLSDSFMFKLFKSRRYAFRVCVAYGLLNPDGSENDMMSGEELIEFLRLASEYKEKGVSR